ncbi:MAG: hypothetical protein KatS3mg070_0026 [Meiothermus sp.]|uniref:hypothetical protein n=1 Tax=Meiothermus sp. TaxID=1955249 RepID=UPI0021DE5BA4|nr:hypothetical protein [Meiothermus sp.]GIW26663.1 MAG: hypothetical protein KatS3mg070_0026 [Meiothermus sp.]
MTYKKNRVNKKTGLSILGDSVINPSLVVTETPGRLEIHYERSPSQNSLNNLRRGGFDGLVQSGRQAIRRIQKHVEDLQALGFHPCYLVTLTLPTNLRSVEWCRSKEAFRADFSRLLSKQAKGAVWWQGFQSNRQPHLHILTDLDLEHGDFLGWLKRVWSKAVGTEVPSNCVDLKYRSDFRYLYSSHTFDQAMAPYKDHWGKWAGFMGVWLNVRKQVQRTQITTTLEPSDSADLLEHIRQLRQRNSFCEWFDNILKRFLEGWYRAIWIAKRFFKKACQSFWITCSRFVGREVDTS